MKFRAIWRVVRTANHNRPNGVVRLGGVVMDLGELASSMRCCHAGTANCGKAFEWRCSMVLIGLLTLGHKHPFAISARDEAELVITNRQHPTGLASSAYYAFGRRRFAVDNADNLASSQSGPCNRGGLAKTSR
jgi:hypothetical protein